MLFDSPVYLLFLTLVVVAYWRLPHRAQNVFLLVCSYVFYGWWDWRFLGLIAVSSAVDFVCAIAISSSASPDRRRALLAVSVSVNLCFLGFFKYFGFFADSLHSALASVGFDVPKLALEIVLPPGISFYTFQALAYIIDVYKRRMEPARSIVDYSLFISFFPHLIAGPIQRPTHLLPQVQNPRTLDREKFSDGLMLILSGLFRKCVIADQCSLLADAAFDGRLGAPSLASVAIGTYAFAWQIYGDFSGYSNIARGSAQLMGFHFMVNFRQPYVSTTLQDFWRRWHISLSSWLRDYLYIGLGGNRHGVGKTYRNLFLTMLIGGLWHGANWTFVVWGAIHGGFLALERALGVREARSNRRRWVQRIFIFHVVCVSWVFFRADSVNQAISMLAGLANLDWRPEYAAAFAMLAAFALPLWIVDAIESRRGEEFIAEKARPYARLLTGSALALGTMLLAGNKLNAFIYFQF